MAQFVGQFKFQMDTSKKEINRDKTDFLPNRNLNSLNETSVDIYGSATIHCDDYRLWM